MNWLDLLTPYRNGSSGPLINKYRSSFEQDFDRIIFSHPFRKLQDKTQVFPLPEEDFVHTRLTHSLEVSSVGRSLGRVIGEEILKRNPDLTAEGITSQDFGVVVAAASLAHDIGNPPFGHSGESAISEFFLSREGLPFKEMVDDQEWSDLINFEGNAQGFRLLNSNSMKLTYPVLGAFTKYPRLSYSLNRSPERRSQKKFGVFESEKEQFELVATRLGLIAIDKDAWCRHPLAFLVEAADDICYHIIDLEDGCTLDLIDEETTVGLLRQIIGDDFNMEKYKSIPAKRERIGMLRAMAINKLIQQTTEVFLSNEAELLAGTFDKALVDLIPSNKTLQEIIQVSITKLYRSKKVIEIEAAGFEVISGLLGYFLPAMHAVQFGEPTERERSICRLIPESYQLDKPESSIYGMVRDCLDYVSSMTDSYAINVYRRINGMSLPGI
jgi:dGTPase